MESTPCSNSASSCTLIYTNYLHYIRWWHRRCGRWRGCSLSTTYFSHKFSGWRTSSRPEMWPITTKDESVCVCMAGWLLMGKLLCSGAEEGDDDGERRTEMVLRIETTDPQWERKSSRQWLLCFFHNESPLYLSTSSSSSSSTSPRPPCNDVIFDTFRIIYETHPQHSFVLSNLVRLLLLQSQFPKVRPTLLHSSDELKSRPKVHLRAQSISLTAHYWSLTSDWELRADWHRHESLTRNRVCE